MKNDKNITPISFTDMEPDSCNELLGAKKIKRLDSQCCLHFHSKRYRLADPDGLSAKAVIDGIVKTGLLRDDTAQQIKQITYSQEKIKKDKQEETIVTIYGNK